LESRKATAWTGIAIGYEGDPATLPDNLKQRDLTPRQRKPLKEFVFTGKWGESGTLPGETLGLQDMEDSFQVTCPYCGDVEGSLVQEPPFSGSPCRDHSQLLHPRPLVSISRTAFRLTPSVERLCLFPPTATFSNLTCGASPTESSP
jgi:hypothetical protein